jgi:hypothetical protein
MFVVACMNWAIALYWTGANLRQEWSVFDPTQPPLMSIVVPSARWLFFMGVVMMIATVITMMMPDPVAFWGNPYDDDWILVIQTHAAAFFIDGLAMFAICIAVSRLKGAQKKAVPRVILALTLYFIQLLIEAPSGMPYSEMNKGGWDHNSLVLDFCYHQIGQLNRLVIATLLVEVFVANRAVVYVRLGLQTGIALFWTFMAFAFLEWCDNLDDYKRIGCDTNSTETEIAMSRVNPFMHDFYIQVCGKCSAKAQGVQIFQARMAHIVLASLVFLLVLMLWTK